MLSEIEFDVKISRRGKDFIAACPSIGTIGSGETELEAIESLKKQTYKVLIGSVAIGGSNN